MKILKILFSIFFSFSFLSIINTNESTNNSIITLFIIGDSTASDYKKDLYPRTGWGQVLQKFFNKEKIVISNQAVSGRSSKSFYEEKLWENVITVLKKRDYVFIQFGHNDQKNDNRHTDPKTTFKQFLSTYIKDTRKKGAYPVLLTPINRNNWNAGKIIDTHGEYPEEMRKLAKSLEVPLIDLHKLTLELFEKMNEKNMNKIFLILEPGEYKNYPKGNHDNTHLQESGALEICTLLVNEIIKQNLDLKQYLITK